MRTPEAIKRDHRNVCVAAQKLLNVLKAECNGDHTSALPYMAIGMAAASLIAGTTLFDPELQKEGAALVHKVILDYLEVINDIMEPEASA